MFCTISLWGKDFSFPIKLHYYQILAHCVMEDICKYICKLMSMYNICNIEGLTDNITKDVGSKKDTFLLIVVLFFILIVKDHFKILFSQVFMQQKKRKSICKLTNLQTFFTKCCRSKKSLGFRTSYKKYNEENQCYWQVSFAIALM